MYILCIYNGNVNEQKSISISTQTTTSTSMSTSKSRKPQVNPFQSLMKVERLWEKKITCKANPASAF